MRILITNNHLERMGGTETWVLTMARYLAKEHTIGVYTRHKGYVSDLLAPYIDDDPKGYDLALINHNSCINVGAKYKIFTSHGMWNDIEKPAPGCDEYVAVSENVAEYHNLKRIIKNPIDTARFAPNKPINKTPENILAITHCEVPFGVIRPSRLEDDMDKRINAVDLVITRGRGVLEAMSCARNVIVWDERPFLMGGDGYKSNPGITGNVGGEYKYQTINWNEELAKYNHADGARNRKYIKEHHDVTKIAKEYISE